MEDQFDLNNFEVLFITEFKKFDEQNKGEINPSDINSFLTNLYSTLKLNYSTSHTNDEVLGIEKAVGTKSNGMIDFVKLKKHFLKKIVSVFYNPNYTESFLSKFNKAFKFYDKGDTGFISVEKLEDVLQIFCVESGLKIISEEECDLIAKRIEVEGKTDGKPNGDKVVGYEVLKKVVWKLSN